MDARRGAPLRSRLMSARSDRRGVLLGVILEAMGVSALTGVAALGCGGNVVVDGDPSGGAGGTSSTSTSSTNPACDDTSGWGEPMQACLPQDGDVCPLPGSSATLAEIAKALGVCVDAVGGNCCNEPSVDHVVCQLPLPAQCCYIVLVADGLCIGG
jgi:hypothetical protein